MSAPASNTPTADASKEASSTATKQEDAPKELPQLGALEEDDEFEEFAQQGEQHLLLSGHAAGVSCGRQASRW